MLLAMLEAIGDGVIANLYVDGFNLYFGAMKGNGGGYKWLDLAAMAAKLLPKDHIKRIRYFTANWGHVPQTPSNLSDSRPTSEPSRRFRT
jgi:hypothetical protein